MAASQSLPVGTIIGEKYEILKKIGQGGMSVVYLVMDTHLNKNWALKEVRKDGIRNYEVVRQGLIVETNMLKKLSHPHLPRIVDVIDEEGVFYVVMDYIEGQTLSAVLNEYGAQPQDNVIEWAKQLCDVLNYLHTRKPPIIYRDMKPGNVMLKPEGDVVLFDFGIAREYKESNIADTTCLGTIGYAAPEQFGGHGQTDPRTDIYCLGATMYHLVTGRNPSEPPYEMYPIRQINPSLSAGLEKIILKCTQRNPADRYQNCAELMYALEHYNEIDDAHRKVQKRKVTAFAIPLAVGIVGVGVALFGYFGNKRQISQNYAASLTKANNEAQSSIYENSYDPSIVTDYTSTIDLDPSREDAYLRLLDYCESIGQPEAGLTEVCSRIDSGTDSIDKNNEVLYRVATMYFGGSDSMAQDYTKAGKYFAMIDEKEMPEAAYYSELASALAAFSKNNSWDDLAVTLENFSDTVEAESLSIDKVRNEQLIAGFYVANKRNFASVRTGDGEKLDPYEKAITILLRARENITDLETDEKENKDASAAEIATLHRQVVSDLASDYANAYTISSPMSDYDKAITYYTELISLLTDSDEIREASHEIADCVIAKGDGAQIRSEMEELTGRYPDDAYLYLAYASYLYSQDDLSGAADMFKKAEACPDAGEQSNLETLRIKLENAGAI